MIPSHHRSCRVIIEANCAMDLLVKNARLIDRPAEGALDIAVADGRIVAIGKELGEAAEVYDAGGRLICAGLI